MMGFTSHHGQGISSPGVESANAVAATSLASLRPLVYLACPYSHPHRQVRLARFESVNAAAALLMQAGLYVFSPISHCHSIAEAGGLPGGWDFWAGYDRAFIGHSHKLIVLMLDGWTLSKGVLAEIAIADEMGIPVEYLPAGGVAEYAEAVSNG